MPASKGARPYPQGHVPRHCQPDVPGPKDDSSAPVPDALRRGRTHAAEGRRDGLDARGQRIDEPRAGRHGRRDKAPLPHLRADDGWRDLQQGEVVPFLRGEQAPTDLDSGAILLLFWHVAARVTCRRVVKGSRPRAAECPTRQGLPRVSENTRRALPKGSCSAPVPRGTTRASATSARRRRGASRRYFRAVCSTTQSR